MSSSLGLLEPTPNAPGAHQNFLLAPEILEWGKWKGSVGLVGQYHRETLKPFTLFDGGSRRSEGEMFAQLELSRDGTLKLVSNSWSDKWEAHALTAQEVDELTVLDLAYSKAHPFALSDRAQMHTPLHTKRLACGLHAKDHLLHRATQGSLKWVSKAAQEGPKPFLAEAPF